MRRLLPTYAMLLLIGLAAVACSNSQEKTQRVSPDGVTVNLPADPESLAAKLGESDDLTAAMERFAAELAIDPEQVVVRIQFRGCETCENRMPPKKPPDLSPDEARTQLQPNDKLWLAVPGFSCYYSYDGKILSPLACQPSEPAD